LRNLLFTLAFLSEEDLSIYIIIYCGFDFAIPCDVGVNSFFFQVRDGLGKWKHCCLMGHGKELIA
jgi:hypothetical protein